MKTLFLSFIALLLTSASTLAQGQSPQTPASPMQFFVSGTAGGYYQLNDHSNDQKVLFSYGARLGLNVAEIPNFSNFAIAIAYDRQSQTETDTEVGLGTLGGTVSTNEILLQLYFRKVGGSGFYFGPEIGVDILASNVSGTVLGAETTIDSSTTVFDFGGFMGYEFFLGDNFSIAPEVHVTSAASSSLPATVSNESVSIPTNNLTNFRFVLSGTLYF